MTEGGREERRESEGKRKKKTGREEEGREERRKKRGGEKEERKERKGKEEKKGIKKSTRESPIGCSSGCPLHKNKNRAVWRLLPCKLFVFWELIGHLFFPLLSLPSRSILEMQDRGHLSKGCPMTEWGGGGWPRLHQLMKC